MRLFYLTGFFVLMVFDTLAQVSFKMTAMHSLPLAANLAWVQRILSQPWVYVAILGYIGSFFTWVTLLRRAPIGPAFAASYLEVISVLFCSVWLFHEHITRTQLLGVALIIGGILCLAKGETEAIP